MILLFSFSGSTIYKGKSDCVPPAGADVVFVTQGYKKGIEAGTLVRAVIDEDIPATYDFASSDEVEVTLGVNEVAPISV